MGPEIERLVTLLAKLPGLGPASARRIAVRLLTRRAELMLPLAETLGAAAAAVRPCSVCGNLDTTEPCAICVDPRRDQGLVCVVESVADLWALERAGAHHGSYHVLSGALSAIGGITPDDLSVGGLLQRVRDGAVREVILATSATVDGQATAHFLTDRLKPFGVAITRLAHGVPVGGEIERMDHGTLAAALRARRPV
ncbi:MAG: recombination protein RecR [Acetobacteraceae bacterium]|nr:recombination protein RecR [Acetobacteraceae bacterium]